MERPSSHFTQRGTSLVEALVALVVMSVGMLGIASLYVTSLKTGRSALTRTQAVNLVNDMADRIRANARARSAYEYKAPNRTPPQAQDCAADLCSPAEIARNDLAGWLYALNTRLPPSTVGTIVFTPAPGGFGYPDQYEINVSWKEPGEARDLSYRLIVQLIPVLP